MRKGRGRSFSGILLVCEPTGVFHWWIALTSCEFLLEMQTCVD